MEATPVKGAICVVWVWAPPPDLCKEVRLPVGFKEIAVDCRDYDDYQALPAAVEYGGETYGKTGYNTDTRLAFYSNNRKVAKEVT